MNYIDLQTLALAASLSAGVFLFVPLFLRYVLDADDERGLLYWTAGAAALGTASLVLALRMFDSDSTAIVVGNTCAVLGLGWLYLASRRLLGIAEGRRYVYPVAGLTLAVGVLFTFLLPNDVARIVATSLLLAIFPAASAWLFLRRATDLPPLVPGVTAAMFSAIAAIYIARTIGFTRVLLIEGVDYAPEAVSTLPYLLEVVVNTWLAAMLAIVVSARIQGRLRQERDRVAAINRELTVLSTTDPLTGLANRNQVDHVLGVQSRRADSRGVPVSVILLDIDHFKRVNDDFGHPVGDEVLVHVARILLGQVRENDTVGRWGGEEFIVVLPDTTAAGAEGTAERIRQAIATGDFGLDRAVTASLGVAGHGPGDDAARLVAAADEALYEAKRTGRNRVMVS